MVHEMPDRTLHLGLIKAGGKDKNLCQCNSFLTTYKKDKNSDSFYCNLKHCYEISKIVRENKETKKAETIYQSEQAVLRETAGIEKMLSGAGIVTDDKLLKTIIKLNVKFGKYHTLEMLSDFEQLLKACSDKREEELVKKFIQMWRQK